MKIGPISPASLFRFARNSRRFRSDPVVCCCEFHRFKPAVQFSTTLIGGVGAFSVTTPVRKR